MEGRRDRDIRKEVRIMRIMREGRWGKGLERGGAIEMQEGRERSKHTNS